jgi:hypothetical protein
MTITDTIQQTYADVWAWRISDTSKVCPLMVSFPFMLLSSC